MPYALSPIRPEDVMHCAYCISIALLEKGPSPFMDIISYNINPKLERIHDKFIIGMGQWRQRVNSISTADVT